MNFSRHQFKYYRRALGVFINRMLGREFVERSNSITVEVSGVCNLDCVFCAYGVKKEGKQIMALDNFKAHIDQLVRLGYEHVDLTPQTGDVFIDKKFVDKIRYLEQHDGIKGYEFISNLISASHETLDVLAGSQKLIALNISLYGRDPETFVKITRKPKLQYDRLVKNLTYLLNMGEKFQPIIQTWSMADRESSWTPSLPPCDDESDLELLLHRFDKEFPRFQWTGNHVDLDSWGGLISQDMVDELGLGFEIVGPTSPMKGPCGMLFGSHIILANGKVNACACRAVDQSLIIGDTNDSPLNEIISPDNPAFVNILEKHQKGDYPDACKGCKIFSNIYRRPHGRETMTVQEFLDTQRIKCSNA